MINIFDLSNVDDIAEEVRKDLNVVFETRIIKLFELAKRDLSVDEVTVGYCRKYNEVKTRKQIMGKLYNMARATKPKIESVPHKKGIYRKKTNRKRQLVF